MDMDATIPAWWLFVFLGIAAFVLMALYVVGSDVKRQRKARQQQQFPLSGTVFEIGIRQRDRSELVRVTLNDLSDINSPAKFQFDYVMPMLSHLRAVTKEWK